MEMRKKRRRRASKKSARPAPAGEAIVRVDPELRDRLKVYTITARPKVRMREAADEALADYLRKKRA